MKSKSVSAVQSRPSKKPEPAAAGGRKVIVEFPDGLLKRMGEAAAELSVARSTIIRSAVEQYLGKLEKTSLERQLAEGYASNAALDRRIAGEFRHVDSENL